MKRWPWKLYGFFLTLNIFGSLGDVFSIDSPLRMYYTVLIAFNKYYVIALSLNILSIFTNLLAPLVVLLYAFDIKSPLKFWKLFFWVRLILDVTGHNYDIQLIKSCFFQSTPYGLACLGVLIIPFIPSYMANYYYAYQKTNVK